MKVAIIGSRGLNSYSGIERVLAQLVPRVAALGHEIHVFGEGEEDDGAPLPPGVRSVRVPALRGKFTETISRSFMATALAMTRDYDVINLVAIGPGILSALPRLAGKPVVVSIHGLDWRRAKWPLSARLALQGAERTIAACADEITVVSHELETYFRETYGREAVHTPNGVEARSGGTDVSSLAAMGLVPGRYVLFASRLVPEKGAHELIEAFQRLPAGMTLAIAGGGRYDQAYVDALRASDVAGRCVFTGHLTGERLEAVFAGAYLYVLPSHVEGFSLSLLEAMGHGKAPLVSDIAENVEAIDECGFRFPVGDVAALASNLTRLISSPDEVAAMGGRAKERARRLYSWDAVASRYAQIYESLGRRARPVQRPARTEA